MTGQVLGVSLSGAILQAVLMKKLPERIQGPGSAEVNQQCQSFTVWSRLIFHSCRSSIESGDYVLFVLWLNDGWDFHGSHSTDVIHSLNPRLKQATVDSYADALRVIFIFQAVCNTIGCFTCLPIQEGALSRSDEEQQTQDWDRNGQNADAEETGGTSIE